MKELTITVREGRHGFEIDLKSSGMTIFEKQSAVEMIRAALETLDFYRDLKTIN